MGKKSVEDVMNEIEDFLNSCKTTALSSNKVVVPRDKLDELFGDLKVKIPAEIDRCKKIMRNKEAILMDARKTADGIIAQAKEQENQLLSQTEIMALANQKAYETVEMARVQANEILAQAVAEANEIRLGSMQYTNDIMMGIRNYVEATMQAERVNYENLIEALNNDYLVANANMEEIQSQIIEFTGDPNSVVRAAQMKAAVPEKKAAPKGKQVVVQKVKQADAVKEEKKIVKEQPAPPVNIPDFITNGEKAVQGKAPAARTKQVEQVSSTTARNTASKNAAGQTPLTGATESVSQATAATSAPQKAGAEEETAKKVKKKIVKKKNPVLHTPQTAQETVAKTLEAAAAAKGDKTVYKANGEQAREISSMDGRVKRGPRVGRGMVEGHTQGAEEADAAGTDVNTGTSLGVVDDLSMEEKF